MKIGRRLKRLFARREADPEERLTRRVRKAHLADNVRRERGRAESKIYL